MGGKGQRSRSENSSKLTAYEQKALKERGIDQMLEEARADNRENDLENMKPSCEWSRFPGCVFPLVGEGVCVCVSFHC